MKRLFINKKICLFINSQIGLIVVLSSITYFCERRSKNILYKIKKNNIERGKTQLSIFFNYSNYLMLKLIYE